MDNKSNSDRKNEQQEQLIELGSDISKGKQGTIYTLTIIGQIEGHQVAPDTVKTTKYEHILPLLAGIEESDEYDGLLLLLNTVGGDIEAGLAIAELIAAQGSPQFVLENKYGTVPKKLGVVSSEFHLLRVNMIAKDLQLDVRTVPAGTSDTQAFFTYFVREIFMVWLDGIKVAIF